MGDFDKIITAIFNDQMDEIIASKTGRVTNNQPEMQDILPHSSNRINSEEYPILAAVDYSDLEMAVYSQYFNSNKPINEHQGLMSIRSSDDQIEEYYMTNRNMGKEANRIADMSRITQSKVAKAKRDLTYINKEQTQAKKLRQRKLNKANRKKARHG